MTLLPKIRRAKRAQYCYTCMHVHVRTYARTPSAVAQTGKALGISLDRAVVGVFPAA